MASATGTSTPQRRSARLSNQASGSETRLQTAMSTSTPSRLPKSPLSTLLEREDTPDSERRGGRGVIANLDAIASPAPKAISSTTYPDKPIDKTPKRTFGKNENLLKTPASADKPRPESEEMHPSFYHSAVKAKKADEQAVAVNEFVEGGVNTPTSASSPTKSTKTPVRAPATSSYDFNFKFGSGSRRVGSTELSSEAQKMMDQVREQAARIKQQLSETDTDPERALHTEIAAAVTISGRKIATPKGRFSDVHNANFKKMDSIANHPSTFRAEPLKSNPVATSTPTKIKSLKRTQSKASLADRETAEDTSALASPAKRLKSNPNAFETTTTPVIASAKSRRATAGFSRFSKASAFSTPTKSSLARSSSVRTMKSSRSFLPSLVKSPSMHSLAVAESQTERKPSFTDKLSNLKSILRQPLLKVSTDPFKIAAGTHVSPDKADVATPTKPSPTKHVNFSPSPVEVFHFQPHGSSPVTPSPAKKKATSVAASPSVSYPSLEGALADDITTPTAAVKSTAGNTTPRDFTFQPNFEIKFASPKPAAANPTIRHVRASDTPAGLSAPPQKLDQMPPVKTLADMPTVPHGLSNKKRKRESEDATDKENHEPTANSPGAKRARRTLDRSANSTPTRNDRVKPSSSAASSPSKRIATPKRLNRARSVISLSRLNDLARPKEKK